MKFTNDAAIKELIAKLTAKGEKLNLSERSIKEQVEALLPIIANEEMELDDFVTKVLPVVKTADANVRNDVSQGIKDYKASNPIKTAEPQKDTQTATQQNASVNDELINRIAALEKRNQEYELAQKIGGIKSSLTSKLKELGVKDSKWISSLLSQVNISEDTDIESKAKDLLELYNASQSSIDVNVTPLGASGGKSDYIANVIEAAAGIAKS